MIELERQVLIACNTLKGEIEHVSAELGTCRRTIWLESQLHNEPENLARKLQEALDSIEDADVVLLGYGNCGNVIQGLVARDFRLIVPRIDDCISILFGSQGQRTAYSDQNRSIFLTDGWMDEGHNILAEFQRCVDKYGREKAEDIFDMLYKHYESMAYLDTGLYDIDELKERTCEICKMLGLDQRIAPATLDYVRALLTGPWPEDRFVCVGPGEAIPAKPFMSAL